MATRRAAAPEVDTISSGQWAEAKKAFDEHYTHSHGMTEVKYHTIVQLLEKWEQLTPVERREVSGGNHVYWRNKYLVTEAQGVKDLLVREDDGSQKICSHRGRMFDDIKAIHIASNHARNVTLHKAVVAKFGNSIPRIACITFVKCCPGCIIQTHRVPKVAGFKPLLTRGFGRRGQVDLIDMQSFKDGNFCYLLVYQDHGIKLPVLEPLQSKRGAAVAVTLIRIFSLIGPPKILQTDNGREFRSVAGGGKAVSISDSDMADIITELKQMWPECKLVHGRARHSQSQGGVERLNQTVQRRLAAWMKDTGSKNWSVGCKLVQWTLVTSYHTGVKQTPYELAFGQKPSCGLSSLPVSPELLRTLATEQDLSNLLEGMGLRHEVDVLEVGGEFNDSPPQQEEEATNREQSAAGARPRRAAAAVAPAAAAQRDEIETTSVADDVSAARVAPLFAFPEEVIRTADVMTFIREAAEAAGEDPSLFNARALRIGGATDLYHILGADEAERTIQKRGRWCSECHQIYTRMSATVMCSVSAQMAEANGVDLEAFRSGYVMPAVVQRRRTHTR
ncbi:hypothetical protein AB1Y20_000612 [Prymnesium parvum]|uniref:Integrase catalytic domain-containing protein n=1 Tax=Prymnesium parvum TaxID=97485 RepID=A0AB34K5U7_PRYPA